MIEIKEETKLKYPWSEDMEYCLIAFPDGDTYCGIDDSGNVVEWCEGFYNGEAICQSCGSPTCPRCAQLSHLEDQVEA